MCCNVSKWSKTELDILKTYYPIGASKLCKEKGLKYSNEAIRNEAHKLGIRYDKTKKSYKDEDIAIVKKYYPKGGAKCCIDNGISLKAYRVNELAKELGVKYVDKKYEGFWTEEDIQILKDNYNKGINYVLSLLEGKTKMAIRRKACNLGLQAKEWTKSDIATLKKYYVKGGSQLCKEKGVRWCDVYIDIKAKELGLYYIPAHFWQKEEDDYIKKYYGEGGSTLCIAKGLKRSTEAIRHRAMYLGIKNIADWTKEEEDVLLKYYKQGGYKLCQQKGVNRSECSIYQRAFKLGLNDNANGELWSEEEDNILKTYYKQGGYGLCKEKGLKRSSGSTYQRVSRLGLNGSKPNIYSWTDEELAILHKYYPIGGVTLCKEKGLKRSSNSIYQKAHKYSLYKK